MDIIVIFLIALLIDIAFSEPPNILHPVAWLGKLISLELKLKPSRGKLAQLIFGTAAVLMTTIIVTIPIYFVTNYLQSFHIISSVLISALILKYTFSIRGLSSAAKKVKKAISNNNLTGARSNLRALVSRDTSQLNKNQIIAATVESIAENSCDSIVAPFFYFAIFGLPGAVVYRIINTFDSMIGYHGEWEYIGKFAARIDDIANFIPARITALLISGLAWICRCKSTCAWHIMIRDHNKTESPNAGWTMSAAAGALDIQLEKTGHYILGDTNNTLTTNAINKSVHILIAVTIVWSVISIIIRMIYSAIA